LDIATLVGFVVCFGMVLLGIITSAGLGGIVYYLDLPSVAITFGGSFSAVFAQFDIPTFVGGIKSFSIAMKASRFDVATMISKIIELSNVARKEGLLALEEAASSIDDEFMKKGILLVVDGTDPELVRAIMETEMLSMDARHKQNFAFWDAVAAMGPAWGMIGTLVGLVNMLQNMDDPAMIGPNMAVALITTLYGSLLANWICAPINGKLKSKHDEEYTMREVMVEGLLSIQAGENPRVIEEKLKSFLAPSARKNPAEGSEEA